MGNTAEAVIEKMSAELRDELAANDTRRLVDPRTLPARFHNLRAVATSPAHGFASFQGFGFDSLATRIGTGAHALLFADKPVAPLPPHIKQRRGKAFDAWKLASDPATVVLSRKEYERACRIRDSIRRHDVASNILFGPGTVREGKILWTQRGRARQSTPDVRGPYHLGDLKSTRCSEPGKFIRDAGFRSYHVQLADYSLAVQAETGTMPTEVYIVAVESAEPYAVTVFQVSDATMRKGRHLAELWLGVLLECEMHGSWSRAYTENIELLDIADDGLDLVYDTDSDTPDWAKPDPDEEP